MNETSGADLGVILSNLGSAASAGIRLVVAVAGVAGVVIFARGLLDIIERALAPGRRETGPLGIAAKLLIGAALTVMPFMLWGLGETIVLGGGQTHSLFSYLPPQDTGMAAACQSINSVVVLVFALLGVSAFFKGLLVLHQGASGHRRHVAGEAATWLIGGTIAFLITDTSTVIGNTLHMRLGLDQLCAVLGAG